MNIKLKNITKKIKRVNVLDNINVEFEAHKIHGIFGAHNSGKSLLLNLISRYESQTSGEILYNDEINKYKDLSLCYISNNLTLILNFKFSLKGFKKVFPKFDVDYAYSLFDKFGLKSNRMDQTASTGTISLMRIILTLASNTDVLIFDDIINGLDIFNRKLVYNEILEKYNKDKQTIFMACSYINEVESLLNDYVIIANNKIEVFSDINELDKCFVLSGNVDAVLKYNDKKHVIKTQLDNFVEMIVIDCENNFDNVEVKKASLSDLVLAYGGKYEK